MGTIVRSPMLLGFGCLIFLLGAWAQDSPELKAILERLQSIEAQLQTYQEGLRKNEELLESISSRLEILEQQREESGPRSNFTERGSDSDALKKIKFPENPEKRALEDYIQEILKATEGQNTFSPDDPQVKLLAAVGEEHLDLLIDAMTYSPWHDYHATQAIIRLATSKSKGLILNSLPNNHELIDAVVGNGWEADAKETLVNALRAGGSLGGHHYLPEPWIQAVASFEDPETYDALLHYFVHGSNRLSTYDAIHDLAGIEIAKHIPEAWRKARTSHQWERVGAAIVAVEYGEADALAELIAHLDSREFEYYADRIRRKILEHTIASGSNEDLSQWYETNKNSLVFDERTKKFKIQ